MMRLSLNQRGFTLIELLIALFIFTMLSMMLSGALHSIIASLSGTESNAERLRQTQMALLLFERDVEQAVSRPILAASGREEAAFQGTGKEFSFTHLGMANPDGMINRSAMQRSQYRFHDDVLERLTWNVLDQAPATKPHARVLLTDITSLRFEYLAKNNHFYDAWPVEGETTEALPQAVRITMTIGHWGSLTQLYVISANENATPQQTS